MDQQAQLREALGALTELAAASDMKISIYDVWDACDGLDLDSAQIEMVCSYLTMNQVEIDGYTPDPQTSELFRKADEIRGQTEEKVREPDEEDGKKKKDDPTGEKSAYYQMYLEELNNLPVYEPEEEDELVARLLAGDEEARERLVEGNLRLVVRTAGKYLGRGLLVSDLVQEGNMALFLAMETYQEGDDFQAHLAEAVEDAIREAVRVQTGADDISETLAADANALMRATEELAEQLDREATSEELAAYLHMSKDRVESLVKMSLDAMNISNDDSSGDGEEGT